MQKTTSSIELEVLNALHCCQWRNGQSTGNMYRKFSAILALF